jgi:hypothetical protein
MPAGAPGRGRWALGISLIGLVALFAALTVQKIWSADTWWQLKTGQWILEHRAWPRLDQFSYTVPANEWIELRWIYCVLLYLGWQAGGPALVIAGVVAAVGAAFAMIIWPSRRALAGPAGVLVVGAALVAGMARWVARPELVTYLLVAVFLVVLEGVARGSARRRGWLLPALQVAWVNSHTVFIMGPVLAWLFAGSDAAARLARRVGIPLAGPPGADAAGSRAPLVNPRLVAIAALTTAACWLNPYLTRGALFPLLLFREVRGDHITSRYISEFLSPLEVPLRAWTWDMWAGPVLAGLVAGTFALNWRRLDLARLGVFAAGAYLAALSQRNAGLLAVMGCWAGLRNLAEARVEAVAGRAEAPARRETGPWRRIAAGALAGAWRGLIAGPGRVAHAALGLAMLGAAWYVATDRYAVRTRAPREFGVGVVWWNTARSAVDFLESVGAPAPGGRVYHWMADGAYLIWRSRVGESGEPTLPVYVDGRLEVYGEEFLREYFEPDRAGWRAMAARRGITAAIVPVRWHSWLISDLAASEDWALVHIDHRNLVFLRAIPEHAGIIARWRIDPARPYAPRGAEPEETLPRWRVALGCVRQAWYSEGMARAFVHLRSAANAAEYAARACRVEPGNARMRLLLAQVLLAAGRHAEAKAAYEWALARGEGDAEDWMNLGLLRDAAGDAAGAIAAYERCLRLEPARHAVHNQLGIVHARRLDLDAAERHFLEALRLKPDFEGARRNLEFIRAQRKGR